MNNYNNDAISNIKEDFHEKTFMFDLIFRIQNEIIENKSDSNAIVNSMNNLRRLLKFHKELFTPTFNNLYDHFEKFIFNQNEQIVMVTFVLISEILAEDWSKYPEFKEWVMFLTPFILEMTGDFNQNNNESFIKNLTENCLDAISEKSYDLELIYIFLEGMKNINENISNYSSKCLFTFIKLAEKFNLIHGISWDEIFLEIYHLYTIKERRHLAEGLVKTLQTQILGTVDFEELLSHIENEEIIVNLLAMTNFNLAEVNRKREQNLGLV